MSTTDTQNLRYPYVLRNASANGFATPILTADFKTIKAVMKAISSPNFNLVVYGSFNAVETIPDVTAPQTANNEYHLLGYTNDGNGNYYDSATPFNPATVAGTYAFNIETTGETWVIFGIASRVAGTVEYLNCNVFSNFN